MRKKVERETELPSAKREQILRGARSTFREQGYERASVDAIAVRAKVSKATIYNHFHDKKALFLATLGVETEGLRKKFLALLETPTGDIEADLRSIGRHLLELVSAPADLQRYRLVCAEIERFPDLGKELYASSMQVGRERMTHFFRMAGEAGQLQVDAPEEAATDFAGLLIHALSLQLHLGVIERASEALIAIHVDRAVRTFLRAYRP